MNTRYATASFLLAATVFVAAPGCHRATATEEDHLEHHVPPHKPANLASAIEQIEQRFEVLAHARAMESAEQTVQLKELLDIVRWLPEIAGDTDLPEEHWNTVDQVSGRLSPLLSAQLTRAERGSSVDLEPLHDAVDEALRRLRDVAKKLPAPASAVNPHEGHQHD